MGWRGRRTVGIVVAAILLSSCGGQTFRRASGLEFVTDGTEPQVQPVVLTWQPDAALQARIDAGEVILGVFVDRAPLAPGASLLDLADDDCRRTQGCPDAAWLADRDVFATRGSSLQLGGLGDNRTSAREDEPDRHRAVIVLLDASGKRIDESYWDTTFVIDRSA